MSTSLDGGKVQIVAGRTETVRWSGRFLGADGETQVGMGESDHVRCKIAATRGGTPILDLDSDTPTANGSAVTIVSRGSATTLGKGTVLLGGLDTAALEGNYFYELILIDAAAAVALRNKEICRGVITFLAEQGGNLGLP
jgi:hypothetical protein